MARIWILGGGLIGCGWAAGTACGEPPAGVPLAGTSRT